MDQRASHAHADVWLAWSSRGCSAAASQSSVYVVDVRWNELHLIPPVYVTTMRGPTYLFIATLKTLVPKSRWVLTGTAVMLQTDD